MSKHHFKIESSFSPADLFALLRKTEEYSKKVDRRISFEFDWMKRKIELNSIFEEQLEEAVEYLLQKSESQAGEKVLIPGNPEQQGDGMTTIKIGILLQTPDVYIDTMTRALQEAGITGLEWNEDQTELIIPVSTRTKLLGYLDTIETFPLPGYLELKDLGQR